jgi:hypothetical protein
MAEKPGNDDLDLDAIQAQMDLTMAHAHELATSWISPSLTAPATDVFKELEEYMRRPPRYTLSHSLRSAIPYHHVAGSVWEHPFPRMLPPADKRRD